MLFGTVSVSRWDPDCLSFFVRHEYCVDFASSSAVTEERDRRAPLRSDGSLAPALWGGMPWAAVRNYPPCHVPLLL